MTYLFILLLFLFSSCNQGGSSSQSANSSNRVEVPIFGEEDPLVPFAWHLSNTGQATFAKNGGVPGEDMKIKEVHERGITGKGVKIAISDTGVDLNHADLRGNGLTGEHRDYVDDNPATWRNGNPFPIEYVAHGTAVAGLAAAIGWNGIGSRGVAPGARFGAFLFLGNFHNSFSSYEAKLLDQMTGDFDIFNYSYGLQGCEFISASSDVLDAFKMGVTKLRQGKGAVYVEAGGNDFIGGNYECYDGDSSDYLGNTNTNEEHNHPYVILVAAVNAKGVVSSYSTPGSGLWVSAAGGEFGTQDPAMLTTDILTCREGYSAFWSPIKGFNSGSSPLNNLCNYTSVMNGTSSATPVLSGIVALMLEANPALTWRDVKHILAVTADKVDYSTSPMSHPGGPGQELAGHDYDFGYVRNAAGIDFSNTYGFGRVNAESAVQMAADYDFPLGTYIETPFLSSGSLSVPIPDNSPLGAGHTILVSDSYVIESVQMRLTTDHEFIGDLGVELTSPSGTTSKILLVNSNIKDQGLGDFMLITNAFYGEPSLGNWRIKVVDGSPTNTGKLLNWKIKVNGHQ